jgi:hypothetical protein
MSRSRVTALLSADAPASRSAIAARSNKLLTTITFKSVADGDYDLLVEPEDAITIASMVAQTTGTAACTVNAKIGDQGLTNFASITGLSAVSASTTRTSTNATAANVLAASGTTARCLRVTVSGTTGTGNLVLAFKGTVA